MTTIVGRARLTEEEEAGVYSDVLCDCVEMEFEAALAKAIAEAQLAKALRVVVDWLKEVEEKGSSFWPSEWDSAAVVAHNRGHQWPLAQLIEKELEAAGLERPKE